MPRTMTLAQLAHEEPSSLVRLHFQRADGSGSLVLTALEAALSNRSARYFPPEGVSAAELGWPVPYWYASEAVRFERVIADVCLAGEPAYNGVCGHAGCVCAPGSAAA